jgi:hypothetical protein
MVLMSAIGKTLLPKEYQQVEYLESTRTQYIDTNLAFNTLYTYDVSVSYNNLSETYAMGIVGAPSMYVGVHNTLFTTYSDNNINGNRLPYIVGNRVNYVLKNGSQTIDTVEVSTHTITKTNMLNVYLFALNNQNTNAADYFGKTKMYYYKVMQGETVIQHFIPCYRKADNVAGMYDVVNDKFYTNAGTGNFIVGGDI